MIGTGLCRTIKSMRRERAPDLKHWIACDGVVTNYSRVTHSCNFRCRDNLR
jgi:hypothetical protein